MDAEQAIEIIARHAIARSAEFIDEADWENYPDIGERDWGQIVAKIADLRETVGPQEYNEAYAFLKARAEHCED